MITQDLIDAVYGCPKGKYQEALLSPFTPWSGKNLRGKARQYGGHYAHSRLALLIRINLAVSKFGWRARNALVFVNHRWHRRLVLVTPENVWIDWITGEPARAKP